MLSCVLYPAERKQLSDTHNRPLYYVKVCMCQSALAHAMLTKEFFKN